MIYRWPRWNNPSGRNSDLLTQIIIYQIRILLWQHVITHTLMGLVACSLCRHIQLPWNFPFSSSSETHNKSKLFKDFNMDIKIMSRHVDFDLVWAHYSGVLEPSIFYFQYYLCHKPVLSQNHVSWSRSRGEVKWKWNVVMNVQDLESDDAESWPTRLPTPVLNDHI